MASLRRIFVTEGVEPVKGASIPFGAAESGLASVGAALGQVASEASTIVAAERKQQRQDVDLEATTLGSRMALDAGTTIETLKGVERDPDAFAKGADQALNDALAEALKQAKSPATTVELQKKFAELQRQQGLAIAAHRRTLREQRNEGHLTESLANLKVLGSNAPDLAPGVASDPEYQQRVGTALVAPTSLDYFKEGVRAIASATLPEDTAAVLRAKWRDDFFYERGYRDVRANPDTDIGRYRSVLKPESWDRLQKHQDSMRNEAVRIAEKEDKRREQVEEEHRQFQLTELSNMGADKTLTREHVIQARDQALIRTRVEFEHYMTLATKGPSVESDPVLWSAVQADVWSTDPGFQSRYAEHHIRAFMARQVLSGEHGRMALAELGRKRSQGPTSAETAQRTLHNQAYNLAKEEGLRALGVEPGAMVLDSKKQQLSTAFLRAYNARALDTEGNPQPGARQLLLDILPTFTGRQTSEARLSFEDQAKVVAELGGGVPPAMEDAAFIPWFTTQQQATMAMRDDPKLLNQYKVRRDALRELWAARKDYLESLKRRQDAEKKSTGGYSVPKEP